ncbi:MAG: permease-like cell division protein FtsX [Clostridia bacterium]|nr:permease-like cell division protein FtsX [Clostridia bacterium]
MKTNRMQYFFREGVKNIGKNRFMSVASIGTAFATLLILGTFLLLVLNINDWAQRLAKDCQIQVFVHEDTSQESYKKLGEKLKNLSFVEKAEKYTKQDTFNEMKEKLKASDGTSALEGFTEEDNPYRDSYKITVTDPEQTAFVTKTIKEMYGFKKDSKIKFGNEGLNVVANITNSQETVDKITDIGNWVQKLSIWACLILVFISATIISNAIKASVFARRKEIHIMKYIGATNWFVRWPFLVEGMLIGLLGGVLAFFIIWILYVRIEAVVTIEAFKLIPFTDIFTFVAIVFGVSGMLIGFLGSFIGVRRHLKV